MKERPVIYIDVDDTFVRSFGTKRIPMTEVIDKIKTLKIQGAKLYCWSSGSAVDARDSAQEFGIYDCFDGYLPKPTILIDDLKISKWKTLIEIHPNEL